MRQRHIWLGIVAGFGLAEWSLAQKFVFNELRSAGAESKAYSVNSMGQVVGFVAGGDGLRRSGHWLNDVYTDLHTTVHLELSEQEFTVDYTELFGISDGGQMIGVGRALIRCSPDIRVQTGMLLAPAVLSDLGTAIPGDALTNFWTWGNPCIVNNSTATAISNRNHVVGWSDVDGYGAVRAWIVVPQNGRWFIDNDPNDQLSVNGLMIDLGTLSPLASVSSASDVNDSGQVVGYSYTGEASYHAFLVTPNNGVWFEDADNDGVNDLMEDLGTLGGTNSWARGINNLGQIVGESNTADMNTRAFLWDNGVMKDLGTLGGANSSAAAINDNGVIVGWAEDKSGQRRAAVWINGKIHDVNNMLLPNVKPAIRLSEARDVNASGVIVGWGEGATGVSAVSKAFMLRVASASEIAEAEAAAAANNNSSSDPDPTNGGTGGSNGAPVSGGAGTTNLNGNVVGGQTDDAPGGGSGTTPLIGPAACGFGFASTLAPTLLGIGLLRRRRF